VRSKAAVWTVDDVARLMEIKKKQFLFFCLFITVGDPEGEQKLDGSQNATKLYSSYLFII